MGEAGEPWPLAHRQGEIEAFTAALGDPERALVVLYGTAGVGKTRLADACLAAAEADGHLTARVLASEAAAKLPLGALAPILPRDLATTASPRELFERTRDELAELGGHKRPVLMVDDAHLLDTSSAVLLTQLVEAGAVFAVATIREGEALPDAVAGWWRSERCVRLDLRDLDRAAVADVLELALGGVVGTDTVQRLHQASDGNPLLLRELVLQARHAGLLSNDSGTWRLTGAIPPSRRLSDVLRTRIDALGEASRQILDQLAVCAPLGIDELTGDISADELEMLERHGLVRVLVDGHRHQLVLGHPLYGETLRADLTALRRRAILLAVADRTEELGARRREDVRRIATWRLDAGGSPDPDLLLHAAHVARYANDFAEVERLALAVRALAPWAGPDGPTSPAEADAAAEAAILLGEAHYELGRFEASEAVLSAPVAPGTSPPLIVQLATLRTKNLQWGLCDWESALEVTRTARAPVGPDYVDDLIAEEGAVLVFSGRPQEALDVLAPIEPRTVRTEVLVGIAESPALALSGRTAEAIEVAEKSFALHLGITEPMALAHPGSHIINQVYALLEAARLGEAEELSAAGYDVAVADNVPIAQIWFALVIGRAQALRGRFTEAVRWYQEGASTARLHGFHGPLRLALAGQAWTDASVGDKVSAAACIAEFSALPVFPFFGYDQEIGPAWAAWVNGHPAQAREILLDAADRAAASSNRGSAGWLWHDAARLGATGVGPRLAQLSTQSDSPLLHARAAHVLALDADDPVALTAAADRFEELELLLFAAEAAFAASDSHRRKGEQRLGTNLAQRAAKLAERCPGARTPGLVVADVSVPLSNREREIATLAAGGLSSQEIADRLFLSIRTVDNHLQKSYAKLGIRGRDQLRDALGG
jgi:DNA-binding CsgD family transcriptional regulator/type II secretory pathway predicted ATPase ExeA